MLHITLEPISEMHLAYLNKRKCLIRSIGLILFLLLITETVSTAAAEPDAAAGTARASGEAVQEESAAEDDAWGEDGWEEDWEAPVVLADPLEPINRFFFHFNDRLYYWVLKPVATVYAGFIPEELQIGFRNFFDNLRTPAKAVSSLLQGNVRDSLHEVGRFSLNSTAGIIGFGDFAKDVLDLRSSYEDLGQTLAHYGAGGGFYINWPFLGPSNFRDSLGLLGDSYLHPLFFLDAEWGVIIGAWSLDKVNYTALTLGDYELFTKTALDPYAAVKDAYLQYRKGLIENK
jgi:phospholipid-binding lipoprotein MlaA